MTIRDAMESVARQRGAVSIEYLVVDGGSTDGTLDVIKEFCDNVKNAGRREGSFSFTWISERDCGLYDALNKGIRMATGDVIGICNADDILARDDVVARVAEGFEPARNGAGVESEAGKKETCGGIDAVFADIRFVRPEGVGDRCRGTKTGVDFLRSLPTVRYCTGRYFRPWMFRFATFPAHPSTFVRRACFEAYGLYSLDYPICADFEMMLRLFVKHNIATRYLPLCTHVMRMGGASTGGIRCNIAINNQDLRALRAHGIWSCLPLIYLKYFAKVWGFVRRPKYEG